MATFSAVNTELSPPDTVPAGDESTPTTQNPLTDLSEVLPKDATIEDSDPSTPTRHSFGAVAGQIALPDEPVTPAQSQEQSNETQLSLKRDGSTRSAVTDNVDDEQDIEMGDGAEDGVADDDGGSENESINSDSQRPSKKKKGQRFFCTEFPPCQLSFTRSEHLARHIRYF